MRIFGYTVSAQPTPTGYYVSFRKPRKPHRLNTQAAHREHLMAVDRQKMKLAERGTMARLRAWAWEAFE